MDGVPTVAVNSVIAYLDSICQSIGLTLFQGFVVFGMLTCGMYVQWTFNHGQHDDHDDHDD